MSEDRCKHRGMGNKSEEIAKRFSINSEMCFAAGMLHDLADSKLKRNDPIHEIESLTMASQLLAECAFSPTEINILVNDALKFHGCKNGQIPESDIGKVLATADAVVHIESDFYKFATNALMGEKTSEEINNWVSKKIDRDFNDKILFPEIKKEVEKRYLEIKNKYSN